MTGYSELVWQGEAVNRYEEAVKDCNDYTELFDNRLSMDNHRAFFLLAVPPNLFIREKRYANLVLSSYFEQSYGENGSCLAPADCRNLENLIYLLDEVVLSCLENCGLTRFDLYRRIRRERVFNDDSMRKICNFINEICSLANAFKVPDESKQAPYYIQLYMISERLYEQIKQQRVKLPDMIVGIFKYRELLS